MKKKGKRTGDAADLRKRAEEKIRADFHLRFAHSSVAVENSKTDEREE